MGEQEQLLSPQEAHLAQLIEKVQSLQEEVASEEISEIVQTFLGAKGRSRHDAMVNDLICAKFGLEALLQDLSNHPVFRKSLT